MSNYKVELSRRATRQINDLPRQIRVRVIGAIDSLATNPRPTASTNLKELPDCYRLREGDYRVVYTIREDRLIVLVLAVTARKESYSANEIATIRKMLREIKRGGHIQTCNPLHHPSDSRMIRITSSFP